MRLTFCLVLPLVASGCAEDLLYAYGDPVTVTVRSESTGNVDLLVSTPLGEIVDVVGFEAPGPVEVQAPPGGSLSVFEASTFHSFADVADGESVLFRGWLPPPSSVQLTVLSDRRTPERELHIVVGCNLAAFSSHEGVTIDVPCPNDPLRVGFVEVDALGRELGVATLEVPLAEINDVTPPRPEDFREVRPSRTITIDSTEASPFRTVYAQGIIGSQTFGLYSGGIRFLHDAETSTTVALLPFHYEALVVGVSEVTSGGFVSATDRFGDGDVTIDMSTRLPKIDGVATNTDVSWTFEGSTAPVDAVELRFATASGGAPTLGVEQFRQWFVSKRTDGSSSWIRPDVPSDFAPTPTREMSVYEAAVTVTASPRSVEDLRADPWGGGRATGRTESRSMGLALTQ